MFFYDAFKIMHDEDKFIFRSSWAIEKAYLIILPRLDKVYKVFPKEEKYELWNPAISDLQAEDWSIMN